MYDLVYFGYDWDGDSQKYEQEFMEEIKKVFPDVQLENAYDSIKGYRRGVTLDEDQKDNYLCWIIANGWHTFSLTTSIMGMDKDQKNEFIRLINRAKELYPDNFKKEEE